MQLTKPTRADKGRDSVAPRSKVAPEISVIIVSYNVKEFLEQALESLHKALANLKAEVIVVDNASSDGSDLLVKRRFPWATLIRNESNFGFARASNQGIRGATGDFIALLNPDTIVQEDTFVEIVDFLRAHADAGMVGCKILNPDGSLQLACRRSFPTPWVAFTRLSGLSHIFANSPLFGSYNLTYRNPDETYEVDAISGSFMVVRRETLDQVGLLDESFFMYGEDLDWCYRIKSQGWKVIYYPGTQIVHFKGESSKKAPFDSFKTFYKAMGLFAEKHFRRKYFLVPYWMLWVAIWFRAGVSFLGRLLPAMAMPALDLALLCLSLVFGVYLRFGNLSSLDSFRVVMAGYSAVWLLMLLILGCYDRKKYLFWTAAGAISAGFVLNASLTFFFKQYAFSRAVVLYGTIVALLLVPGWRLLIKWLAARGVVPFKGLIGKTLLARRTIIVGDSESGSRLIQKLNSRPDSGYRITGLICLDCDGAPEEVSGVPVFGGLERLSAIIHEHQIQEVVFSTHKLSYDQILKIIANSGSQQVNFKLSPSEMDVIIGKASIDRIDDMPLLEIDYKLHRRRYQILKRCFDLVLSGMAFIPATVAIFICRRLFGAALISHTVVSCGRPVELHELAGRSSELIRKLPYIPAVLKGELSLVGPEAQPYAGRASTVPDTMELKPGLTGIVQVNSFKQLTPKDKKKYEIYYLKNYSLLLDLEILGRSVMSPGKKHE